MLQVASTGYERNVRRDPPFRKTSTVRATLGATAACVCVAWFDFRLNRATLRITLRIAIRALPSPPPILSNGTQKLDDVMVPNQIHSTLNLHFESRVSPLTPNHSVAAA